MLGWIKLDKDMIDDPRVMEIAAKLRDILHYRVVYMRGHGGSDLESNAELTALRCVTVGALVTMWRYAHDHINNDDVLPMGLDTLDTVIGIEGFCALLPPEWLVELNDMTTKLPGYCAKNSLIGKEKAASNNAQRQARYRQRHKGDPKPISAKHEAQSNTGGNGVTSNGVTHTDQDQDQDQDLDRNLKTKTPTAASPPAGFEEFRKVYPKRNGDPGWRKAQRAWNARLTENHSPQDFIRGAERYAAYCLGTGKVGSEYVQQASTFLGPGKAFLLPWALPPKAENASERILRKLREPEAIEHEPDEIPSFPRQ